MTSSQTVMATRFLCRFRRWLQR